MIFTELLPLLGLTASLALGLVLLLWLISIPLRDVSIIDMAFSSIIWALVCIAWFSEGKPSGAPFLSVILISIWALRMTVYLMRRNLGHGEDPRYSRLRGWVDEGWPFYILSLRQVFLLQGVVIWLLILPQLVLIKNGGDIGVLAVLGTVLWLTGFFFESVGDYQLSQFKADNANKGKVLDTGLWRYTRHPNYFGELAQWWGLFLIALESPWAALGVIGPVMYSWLIIKVTGQATLDKKLTREKPEYSDYLSRTSGLIPMPPKSSSLK
ncbi:MAG: DUF1295 domain-containing protein [Pseudomonadales bacterium]